MQCQSSLYFACTRDELSLRQPECVAHLANCRSGQLRQVLSIRTVVRIFPSMFHSAFKFWSVKFEKNPKEIYLSGHVIVDIANTVWCSQYVTNGDQSSTTVVFNERRIRYVVFVSERHHVGKLPGCCAFSVENIGTNRFSVSTNYLVFVLVTRFKLKQKNCFVFLIV